MRSRTPHPALLLAAAAVAFASAMTAATPARAALISTIVDEITPVPAARTPSVLHGRFAPPRLERGLVFPVAGRHRIGLEAGQRFGGARGHKGQDVFARCGTPVVAAAGGRVERATSEAAAGNYLVVRTAGGRSEVYMHLERFPRLREGERVARGQRLGRVGQTGDADGCHLHFEQWTAPGWFRGRAVDPFRRLRAAEG